MLTHSTLLKLVHHGDWFTSIDLKDAYFHIKIYPPHRKFLRFSFLGRGKRIPGSTIRLVSQHPSVCKMYRSGTDSAQGEGHSSRYLRMLYEDLWSLPPEIHEIPFQCSVAVVLSFLQGLIDQGKAFSTIKVYLAAMLVTLVLITKLWGSILWYAGSWKVRAALCQFQNHFPLMGFGIGAWCSFHIPIWATG